MEKQESNLLAKLCAPLPAEGIQKALAKDTHKSYDTIGIGYQWCVDRFNEVCGEKWGYNYQVIKEIVGKSARSGLPFYEVAVEMEIWVSNPENRRKCVGGGINPSYVDALKGAITNAFKKTASFWGVGREAYAGMLDEDNLPQEEKEMNQEPEPNKPSKVESTDKISEKQIKLLYGKLYANNLVKQDLLDYIAKEYGLEHIADIEKKDMENVLKVIENKFYKDVNLESDPFQVEENKESEDTPENALLDLQMNILDLKDKIVELGGETEGWFNSLLKKAGFRNLMEMPQDRALKLKDYLRERLDKIEVGF